MGGRKIEINDSDSGKSGGGNGNTNTETEESIREELQEIKKQADQQDEVEEKPVEKTDAEKVVELTGQLQRFAAEFDNYKKKNAREFERGHAAGGAYILEQLIPVFDSFDSALASVKADESKGLLDGVKNIQRQMLEALEKSGLEVLEPKQGEKMDPNFHEVMLCQETEDIPDNTIWATLQKGYSYKGRLLRAAKVQLAVMPKTYCEE